MTIIGYNRNNRQRGLTLIELLVVGTIIIAVTVASLPVVKPMLESQMTKTGAQIVSTALNRAKNRALSTGRPCGVRFETWDGTSAYSAQNNVLATSIENAINYFYTSGASLVMRQVEVPPVYSGLLGGATVNIDDKGKCEFKDDKYVEDTLGKSIGVRIQFNGSGPYYPLKGHSTELDNGELPRLKNRNGLVYRILFAPRITLAAPMTLPRGTAVDLQFSGQGDRMFDCKTAETTLDSEGNYIPVYKNTDVTIMFSPDGSIESVNGIVPSEPVHFLVGRWDQISVVRPERDVESYPNYADGRNYWVTVNPQTGTVTINQVNPTRDAGYISFKTNTDGNLVPEPGLYFTDERGQEHNAIAVSRELTH